MSTAARTEKDNAKILARGLFSHAPASMQPYLNQLEPVLLFLAKMIDLATPLIIAGWNMGVKAWVAIQPYDPDLLIPMAVGLFMMLFGGSFMMVISCVEAYRICGWHTTRDCCIILWRDYLNLRQKNAEDDQEDLDKDGTADVLEITEGELLTRKMLLFMRVTDPQRLLAALGGIYSGFMAVLATLRVEFARTIALGAGIGDALSKPAITFGLPVLRLMIPEVYHKWLIVAIQSACRMIGVYIASFLARIISAVHSAVRGAYLFANAFSTWLQRKGHSALADTYFDEAFAVAILCFGLFMQFKAAFDLPLILDLLLFPLVLLENFLTLFLAYEAL